MIRRQFLVGIGVAIGSSTAGCLVGGTEPRRTPPPDDRSVVDETWAAGPTEPTCETSGEPHYPFLNRKTEVVPAIPEDADVETVEDFVEDHIEFPGAVTLRETKPARLAWRAQEYDISERYGSNLYYVGYVGEVDGTHRILVVIREDGTRIVNFLYSRECPGSG